MSVPKSKKRVVRESKAIVTRSFRVNGEEGPEETQEETLAVHEFVTAPAEVGLDLGLTLNLGNFESARISVHLTTPCYREEMDDAYRFVERWVKDRIGSEVAEVRESRENPLGF